MTKYEWESELKRNIHRLPSDEIARVLEYYNELFEDNIERGKSEREVIAEFGNPVDVADKILSEYDGELLNDDPVVPPPPPPRIDPFEFGTGLGGRDEVFAGHENNATPDGSGASEKPSPSVTVEKNGAAQNRNSRLTVFVVFNVVTFLAPLIVYVVLWIVLGALAVGGAAAGVGGAYTIVVAMGPLFGGGVGSGLAQIGVGVAGIGFGIILTMASIKAIRLYAHLTYKLTAYIFDRPKKETA